MTAVLIVEDELHIAEGLRFNLEAEGFDVKVASDGETALELLSQPTARFDAIILDVMLPGCSGFDVAQELRQQENYVPILMLTARSRPEDVLRGFETGADDYLPKPFELKILLARLHSLLRRSQWARHQPANTKPVDIFQFNHHTIDFSTLELRGKTKKIHLTLMEADLMRHLIQHEGQAVSRKTILDEVWGLREDTDTRAIDNFIVRLRRYIEDDPAHPKHLLTVRGIGYRFVAHPEK